MPGVDYRPGQGAGGSGGSPTGAAGGSLTGTYPNPTIGSIPSGAAATTQTAGDSSTKVATTAFVATSFAPLASAALAGTPTAPTASALTNTTQVATTAYTDSAITAYKTATATETNKRITKRVSALSANSASPAINTDNFDVCHITAQTATITGFTMTGTPVDGDMLRISITGTTSVPFTLGTSFEASGGQALSTTTSGTARLDMGFIWNTETSKWRQVVAV